MMRRALSILLIFAGCGAQASPIPEKAVRYDDASFNKDVDKHERWNGAVHRYDARPDEIFCGFTLKPHPRSGQIVINNATFEAFDISQSGVTFTGGAGDVNYDGSLQVVPVARFVKKSTLAKDGKDLSSAEWHAACADATWKVDHFKINNLPGVDPLWTGCKPPIHYTNGRADGACWL